MIKSISRLAVFDFDHTIINENSDIYVNKVIVDKLKPTAERKAEKTCFNFQYPANIEEVGSISWTERMNAVFSFMHKTYNISSSEILACIKEIKIDESMKKLLRDLKQNDYDMIIISDANSIFIQTILQQNNLDEIFDKNKIFTNQAYFESTGKLMLNPLNQIYNKNGEKFNCSTKLCAKNICKGTILNDYIQNKEAKVKDIDQISIILVGDGQNDYCPGLILSEQDSFYVRKNYSLFKLLKKEDYLKSLKCKIFYWSTAEEIIEELNL
jgi:pyridoxal phosphate phosphatase PHOSPHO2